MALKLGKETASVINFVESNSGYYPVVKKPEVGMPVTVLMWTDRYPGTIIKVSPSGRTIQFQEDYAAHIDKNGQSENQHYEYTRNPNASVKTARFGKRGWRVTGMGSGLFIGKREKYQDPNF
jgi:hypothetical protein